MSQYWLKYTISLPADKEEAFTYDLLDSTYTLGWTEPQIELITTENGYDYQEQAEQPVTAYVFEPMAEEPGVLTDRMETYLKKWGTSFQLVSVVQVEEENESWMEAFEPVQIGEWTVAPSWAVESISADQKNILWIDPGAAFGTGYHATTQDMLLFLQELPLAGKRVIDVGAGSGILSIYCLKQNAHQPVYALDINPESEYEIKQNLAHNQMEETSIQVVIGDATSPEMIEKVPQKADLILVNIGGDEDVAMLPLVQKLLEPGGSVIFSGLVEWNRESVSQAMASEGFSIIAKRQTEEWVTLLAKQVE